MFGKPYGVAEKASNSPQAEICIKHSEVDKG